MSCKADLFEVLTKLELANHESFSFSIIIEDFIDVFERGLISELHVTRWFLCYLFVQRHGECPVCCNSSEGGKEGDDADDANSFPGCDGDAGDSSSAIFASSEYSGLHELHSVPTLSFILTGDMTMAEFLDKVGRLVDADIVNDDVSRKVRRSLSLIESAFCVSHNLHRKLSGVYNFVFSDVTAPEGSPPSKRTKRSSKCNPTVDQCWLFFLWLKSKRCGGFECDIVESFQLLMCSVYLARCCWLKSPISTDFVSNLCDEFKVSRASLKKMLQFWCIPVLESIVQTACCCDSEEMDVSTTTTKVDILMLLDSFNGVDNLMTQINKDLMNVTQSSIFIDERVFTDYVQISKLLCRTRKEDDFMLRQDVATCVQHVNKSIHSFTPIAAEKYRSCESSVATPASSISTPSGTPVAAATPVTATFDLIYQLDSMLTHDTSDPIKQLSVLIGKPFEPLKADLTDFVAACQDTTYQSIASSMRPRLFMARQLFFDFLLQIARDELKRCTAAKFSQVLQKRRFRLSLYVCCLDLVVYAHSLYSLWPCAKSLECLDLQAYDFFKIVEVVVRAVTTLPRAFVRHLNSVEENCLTELLWSESSVVWKLLENDIPEFRVLLDRKADVKSLLSGVTVQRFAYSRAQTLSVNQWESPSRPSPVKQAAEKQATPVKSSRVLKLTNISEKPAQCYQPLDLVFRKVYRLLQARLIYIGTELSFTSECFEFCFNLAEYVISKQTKTLLFNRSLDQILLCVVYLTAKSLVYDISFRKIVGIYRRMPHSSSAVYRSVPLSSTTSRGDILAFYNDIFLQKVYGCARTLLGGATAVTQSERKVAPTQPTAAQLNHIARLKYEYGLSPRKFATHANHKGSLIISPLKQSDPVVDNGNSAYSLSYTFSASPYKDLTSINSMLRRNHDDDVESRKRASRRLDLS